MKHIFTAISAFTLIFSLAACSGTVSDDKSDVKNEMNEAGEDLKDSLDSAEASLENAGDGVKDTIDPDHSGSVN